MIFTPKPARIKTTESLELLGRTISYTLVQSRAAHMVRFTVSVEKGLEIVVPMRFKRERLPLVLHGKEQWILTHVTRLEQYKKPKFHEGAVLHIFGEAKTLRFTLSHNLSTFVEDTETELIIHMRSLVATSSMSDAQKALEKFLHRRIKRYLETRTSELAAFMQTRYGRITIRAQKSRWGSCSRENNLNFNWRLIFFKPEIIDYVIIHELSHTIHHNHSQKFYVVLEKFCPYYKNLRKKLREHEPFLL